MLTDVANYRRRILGGVKNDATLETPEPAAGMRLCYELPEINAWILSFVISESNFRICKGAVLVFGTWRFCSCTALLLRYVAAAARRRR